MSTQNMFEDELILPGVITEIISDYTANYDTSDFGTTESVTIIGTAFNGPVGQPVPIYSPEFAKLTFGEAFDPVTRREATLIPEIVSAWNKGCRAIYAVRISGKEMYKDYELAVESDLKLRLSGAFPCNANKECYMHYKASQGELGAGIIRVYKPANRTTIQEKMEGVVDNLNSILVAEINLTNVELTKDSKLVDLIDKFNNLKANNVLTLGIVDSDGIPLDRASKEAQSLCIGDIFPGLYTICRDLPGENIIPKTNIELVRVTEDNKPYKNIQDTVWKKLVINTDVRQPYPIHADNFLDFNSAVSVPVDANFEFLKKINMIDGFAVKNDLDYEEVELDAFDIYKRLGKGFVINSKIEKKVRKGKEFYNVVQPNDDDIYKVVGLSDGIYSILQNHKSDYTVLADVSAETPIVGKLPKKDDFKIVRKDIVSLKTAGVNTENVVTINMLADMKIEDIRTKYNFNMVSLDEKPALHLLFDEKTILDGLSDEKYVRLPVIDESELVNQIEGVIDGQLALALIAVVKGENPKGYIVKYNAGTKKFEQSSSNLLGIGKEGDDGYIDQKIVVELNGELRVFGRNVVLVGEQEIANGYTMIASPWLQGEEVKQFILVTDGVASNIYYINSGEDASTILANALVVDEDGSTATLDDQFVLKDEDDCVLVYNMNPGSIIPMISLRHLADGVLKEENFTVVAAEKDLPKLPSVFSDNNTFVCIFSNEIIFCSREEMINKLNDEVLLNKRFQFSLADSSKAQDELPEVLIGEGFNKEEGFTYDTGLYIPYSTTDNFARQLAQYCLYTELTNYPTHGIIGTNKLSGINLSAIAQRVNTLYNTDFDLFAKKNNGNYMLNSDNEPYEIGRLISIVNLQHAVNIGTDYNYLSNGAGGYAGMVSALNIDRSSTNQPINIDALSYEMSSYQLGLLNNKGIVCAKNSFNNGVVIVDGITQAPSASVFRRLSTTRTINEVNRVLRRVIEPYIGLKDSLATRNSLNTAIKSELTLLKDVIISDFKFKIYTNAEEGNLGIIRIDYVIVPLNEIRQVRNQVEVSASISE